MKSGLDSVFLNSENDSNKGIVCDMNDSTIFKTSSRTIPMLLIHLFIHFFVIYLGAGGSGEDKAEKMLPKKMLRLIDLKTAFKVRTRNWLT